MTEDDLYKIVETIADEWQMGGLSSNGELYAELAVETAKRALKQQHEAWERYVALLTSPSSAHFRFRIEGDKPVIMELLNK